MSVRPSTSKALVRVLARARAPFIPVDFSLTPFHMNTMCALSRLFVRHVELKSDFRIKSFLFSAKDK